MEEFHCAASMDDDQEGNWREILQKWDDDQGLPNNMGPSLQQLPTSSTSMLINPHHSLAMESLNPIFLPPNPNSNDPNPSLSLNISVIHSPDSFTHTSISHLNPPPANPISLEAAIIDHLNSSPASLNTNIDADNLISTVRQPEDESSDTLRSSWFSTFLQSLQSHPLTPTGLASSSASYSNLLNIGDGTPQGAAPAAPTNINLYSSSAGLDDMMEQMSNDFINYGAAGSLQEQLSNALCASNIAMSTRGAELTNIKEENELGGTSRRTVVGSGDEGMCLQTVLLTPASSVSSDGGPEDDSDSHEDIKDSLDMANSLDAFGDLIMQGHVPSGDHPHLNILLPSSDTLSSKAAKLQGETSAAPSSNQDQDKKRASKSARVTKKPKRERGAKLAIKIQSDVEVLDDGYKWRKYGQKAVKNSPYPRSYYKCTDKQCKVKKHVERQAHEPDYVVTTYEGVHNHSRPDHQQVQVLGHAQSDITTSQQQQQHADSFQAFVPTPPPTSTHHFSPLEIFGLRPSSLFEQADSQPTPTSTFEALDQGILQTLLHGEPRRSLA